MDAPVVPAPVGVGIWTGSVRGRTVRIEWSLVSKHCGVSLGIGGPGDDEDVKWSFAFPPVALYFGVSFKRGGLLRRIADGVCVAVRDMGSKYNGAEFSVSVHDWSMWWTIGCDNTGWTNKRPRWRDGNFNARDFVCGKSEYASEVVECATIEVCMPEAKYRGRCEIKRDSWARPRGPTTVIYRAHVDMTEPVPVPGKGENSWDCGEDAIYGTTVPAKTFAAAVAAITKSALETRARYGGYNWIPSSSAAKVPAAYRETV